jgi:hypothetical protein
MKRPLLAVRTEVDAKDEMAFNEWYDNIHVPDVLSLPEIIAATRYQLAGAATYLALYEIDGDPERAVAALTERSREWAAAGRLFADMRTTAFDIWHPRCEAGGDPTA